MCTQAVCFGPRRVSSHRQASPCHTAVFSESGRSTQLYPDRVSTRPLVSRGQFVRSPVRTRPARLAARGPGRRPRPREARVSSPFLKGNEEPEAAPTRHALLVPLPARYLFWRCSTLFLKNDELAACLLPRLPRILSFFSVSCLWLAVNRYDTPEMLLGGGCAWRLLEYLHE